MKKIALFGATGRTGNEFLKIATEQGYAVRALVRDTSKLQFKHPQLEVVQGDVLEPKDVLDAVRGTDVVASLFGHVKNSPDNLQTSGTRNITEAMKELGVSKIISLSGGGLPFPEKDEPKFADKLIRFIMKVAFAKVLNDAIAHHKVLANSGLDWIIVRGPGSPPKTPLATTV